jgi:hypothetical protein
MKKLILFLCFTLGLTVSFAQDTPTDSVYSSKIYVVTKNDGTKFVGIIVKNDAREVFIKTKDRGDIYIPKHEIKEIKELEQGQLDSSGNLVIKQMFSTRYFLTTNALPMDKGDNYAQLNLFGPEFHFGVGKTFNLGIMTSWIGAPIIGAAKQSFKLTDNAHFAVGGLFGSGSYVFRGLRWFALPFGALTIGNSASNFNISYGYGMVNVRRWNYSYGRSYLSYQTEGSSLLSIGFMSRLNNKITFVFDSMIILGDDASGFLSPGLRFQIEENKAFQFGFLLGVADSEIVRIPIPMISWFRKI